MLFLNPAQLNCCKYLTSQDSCNFLCLFYVKEVARAVFVTEFTDVLEQIVLKW